MFTQARIKLTAQYLAIIMTISLLFSGIVYRNFLIEFRQGLRHQIVRIAPNQIPSDPFNPDPVFFPFITRIDPTLESEIFEEAKKRILIDLSLINLGILFTAGAAGYFLAGQTLAPIEMMVNDQKTFISDASHELRTPLTAIKTETEVALLDKQLNLTDAKLLLKSNLEEVDKMQKLSNYLLSINQYRNRTITHPTTQVNVKTVCEEIIKTVEKIAQTRGVVIEKDLTTVKIAANQNSLAELINILLDNAIKYSPRGGKVIVRLLSANKKAIIEVQDFGLGIAKTDLPHIFDRFYRADTSRSKGNADGYGLGLAIAKGIVEASHGKILVTSTPGKGSTFKIIL